MQNTRSQFDTLMQNRVLDTGNRLEEIVEKYIPIIPQRQKYY